MNAPNYDWVCQRCTEMNKAGTDKCQNCGFNAYFTVEQLKGRDRKSGAELTIQGVLAAAFVGISCLLYFKYSSALPEWMQFWFDPRLFVFGLFVIGASILILFSFAYKFILSIIKKVKGGHAG